MVFGDYIDISDPAFHLDYWYLIKIGIGTVLRHFKVTRDSQLCMAAKLPDQYYSIGYDEYFC